MEKSHISETTTATTDAISAVQAVPQRKRMLLSEVYVHKVRKLNDDSNQGDGGDGGDKNDDQFDVFHIFEFADDPTTKITPKLSTNCTEPRKIIDVLRNRTGSDTPQLQRLIEKLSAQNRKWTDIHQKQQQRNPTATAMTPPPTTTTTSITAPISAAATAPNSNFILAGRDHIYNRRTGPLPVIGRAATNSIVSTASSTVTTGLRPSTVPTIPNLPSIQPTCIESTMIKKEPQPGPTIRAKTIESLTDANQVPENRPKPQAFAKKSVTVRTIERTPNGLYRFKAANGVMQQQQQQQLTQPINQVTRITNAKITTASAPAAAANPARTAPISYSKLPTMKPTQAKPNPVQQPVKLWNNMMTNKAPLEPLRIHVSVKTRELNQGDNNSNATLSLQTSQEKPIEENASDGGSMLKIGQVFQGVNEDMVDLLQMVPSSSQTPPAPTPQPPSPPPPFTIQSVQSASPMLDTEIEHNQDNDNTNGTQTAYLNDDNVKLVTIVQNGDKNCDDYRCNICLTFNDSNTQYREHMLRQHGYKIICDRCHDAFNYQHEYMKHLKIDESAGDGGRERTLKCSLSANANRTYICIVEPPIILMRNEKVFAFRCKHCDLAFQNQRNYVQHAQRHAKQFRCKQCPTKPLNIDLMREHLTHHKN